MNAEIPSTTIGAENSGTGVVANLLKPLLDTVIAVQSISSVYLVKLGQSQLQQLMMQREEKYLNEEGSEVTRTTSLAVKRIDKRAAAAAQLDAMALSLQEATVLKRLGSPLDLIPPPNQPTSLRQLTQSRVPLFYALDEDTEFVYLAMSYKRGCQLQRLFFGHSSLSLPFIVHIVRQVAFILKGLHTEFKVAYRDLKLSNLHIDPLGHVSLVDFGLSLVADADEGSRDFKRCVGTKHVRAPELYLQPKHSEVWSPFSGDFWSFGVMCWELTFRDPPFPEGYDFSSEVLLQDNGKDMVDACFDETRNPKITAFLAKGGGSERYKAWLSLVRSLLSPDPNDRCGRDWDAVLSHPALAVQGQDPLALPPIRFMTAAPCVRPFVEEIEDQLLGL